MINIVEKQKCCGCQSCFNICPKKCISMVPDEEGFLYPKIDSTKCIHCDLCNKVCPFLNSGGPKTIIPDTYAVINKNPEIRKKSSSGGFFPALMENIFECGGVVYGVAFGKNLETCSHVRITEKEQSVLLMGSKYIQSSIGRSFSDAKNDLERGVLVLFSGTPCQIGGLKRFLGKEYSNLITVALICHGVPSPNLWLKYLSAEEKRFRRKIDHVNFRDKKFGWEDYGIRKKGKGIDKFSDQLQDPYLTMFQKSYSLRPSCYACSVKEQKPQSDFTMGDFWGVDNVLSGFNDGYGTSLVMVHTKKAQALFEKLKTSLYFRDVDYLSAISCNKAYLSSSLLPKEREEFFGDMNSLSFKELAKKYCRHSFSEGIKSYLKKTFFWRAFKTLKRRQKQ